MGDTVMDFFDDLGKKLSQAGQSAVQKTKGMADIVKLSAAISEEEKKINNGYAEIGKLYVSLHGAEAEPEFEELLKTIQDAEEKVKEYQSQLAVIRGVSRCEKCGAEVPANSVFCNICGAAMPEVKEELAEVTEEEV